MKNRLYAALNRKIKLWEAASVLLALVLLLVGIFSWQNWTNPEFTPIEKEAPYAREVEKIILPLAYNGVERLKSPDVFISLDANNGYWILHNIHHFDSDGHIVLTKQRYGLCGELGQYTYEQLKPLLDKEHAIDFVLVAQSGFFLGPQASHLALRVIRKGPLFSKVYILDPSFKRYGHISRFRDYSFGKAMSSIPEMQSRSSDEVFPVGAAVPLIIKKDFLVQLEVEKNLDRFDRDNFVIALTVTKRYDYSGRYVFYLCRNSGETEIFENKLLVRSLFRREEYEHLKAVVTRFFENVAWEPLAGFSP